MTIDHDIDLRWYCPTLLSCSGWTVRQKEFQEAWRSKTAWYFKRKRLRLKKKHQKNQHINTFYFYSSPNLLPCATPCGGTHFGTHGLGGCSTKIKFVLWEPHTGQFTCVCKCLKYLQLCKCVHTQHVIWHMKMPVLWYQAFAPMGRNIHVFVVFYSPE